MTAPSVVVVTGSDPGLRLRALNEAVDQYLGSDDRTLAVEEVTLPPKRAGAGAGAGGGGASDSAGDDASAVAGSEARAAVLGAGLAGARTPPFGTEKRIVVVRSDDGYTATDADLLAAYLADPEPTTVLVLEASERLPAALSKAVQAAEGKEIGTSPGRGGTTDLLHAELQRVGMKMAGDAAKLVIERVGEDLGRIPALVDLLHSTHGGGDTPLTAEQVEPYLGDEGGVPVFELTKAIDAGDLAGALGVATRMTGAMGMHPLQIMAILHSHYRRILRLDDPTIRGEQDAVAALGGKVKPYPAKLAWQQAQRLGTEGVREAFDLLAKADLDLRGATAVPEGAVLEILVARLANLARRSGAGGASSRSSAGGGSRKPATRRAG